MIKYIKEIILVSFLFALISCENSEFNKSLRSDSLTQDETEQVDKLLKDLYESFAYGKEEEPNWALMSYVFVEGAQFVSEVPNGESPHPQTIEGFISNWQNSIRHSNSPTVATSERIIETRATKIGKLIRVDVAFQASKSNDPSPRKPGLDCLILANVDGVWKVLSFVIQYESKL